VKKFIHILFDFIVEYCVGIIGCMMLITILLQIFTRTFSKVPFSWTDELARFSFIWYCFLGSVLTMYKKMHLGIDYFESKMNQKAKFANRIFVYSIEIIFGLLLAIYGFKLLSIIKIQKSPIMRIQMKYIYLSLPVSGVFYTILGINELVSHLVSGKSPQISPAISQSHPR